MRLFKKIRLIIKTMLEKRVKKIESCDSYYDIQLVDTAELGHSPTDDWDSL